MTSLLQKILWKRITFSGKSVCRWFMRYCGDHRGHWPHWKVLWNHVPCHQKVSIFHGMFADMTTPRFGISNSPITQLWLVMAKLVFGGTVSVQWALRKMFSGPVQHIPANSSCSLDLCQERDFWADAQSHEWTCQVSGTKINSGRQNFTRTMLTLDSTNVRAFRDGMSVSALVHEESNVCIGLPKRWAWLVEKTVAGCHGRAFAVDGRSWHDERKVGKVREDRRPC